MTDATRFNLPARLLHWSMAALILTMLLVGDAMVTSLANDHALAALHRPLQSHHCCDRRRAIEASEVQI